MRLKSLNDEPEVVLARSLYSDHMKLTYETEKFMWEQCSQEYRQAWITIASAVLDW